jgi:hypothetical protein
MVNQGPDRRRQATPGRKDDVKDTLLAAPIREHMDHIGAAATSKSGGSVDPRRPRRRR